MKALSAQSDDSTANSSDSESSDGTSSDDSQSTQDLHISSSNARIHKTFDDVAEAIRSLYRISTLLKRPRNANKYLKSRTSKVPSQTLSGTEDYTHIEEKLRQWRGLTMRQQVGEDDEKPVTAADIQQRKENESLELADIRYLCQRLTWANILRRKQFKYWFESPDVPEPREEPPASHSAPMSKNMVDKPPSGSRTTFSSVAISELDETRTEVGRLRTVYTESTVGRSTTIRVPTVPECSKHDTKFECPFCHIELGSKRMQDRMIWK